MPGLMHVRFGPYHVRDVKFVAAFDVDAKKVGFDLSEAIFASENNTIKIADVPPTDVVVQRGPTLDGIGKYYADTIELSDADAVDVVKVLRDNEVDVLVSYLPVGSDQADKFYASARSTPTWRSSTRCRCSSHQIRCGPRSSLTPGCRSSATTSRARSARRSPIGCWPSCSRTAGCNWTARCSSTWAATWTS
ncbi:inositol-3-phosphate synthase [Mycobacterium xenopi 4042]|uniref:Inositol-3-phosphate synthase n=1 Tax=Mycobacterium xenopi 4042 TaxID=1299334 RepID=X8CL42_MYCXE|nr:inositol-3-phosphate synthase [Mycobacterium xenopi 4042]